MLLRRSLLPPLPPRPRVSLSRRRAAVLGAAAIALVAALAPGAPATAAPEPAPGAAGGVFGGGEAALPSYGVFHQHAMDLVDGLVAAGVLQTLRGAIGKAEADRFVKHWRTLDRMRSPGDQVAYILERFQNARARIGAAWGKGATVRALTDGPRAPVMEAVYMAIVASALEEGQGAFRDGRGSSELDGIYAGLGRNYRMLSWVYWIEFPAGAERRFTRGVQELARERGSANAGPRPAIGAEHPRRG